MWLNASPAAVGALDGRFEAMAIPNIVAAPTQNQKDLPYLCDGENETGKWENSKKTCEKHQCRTRPSRVRAKEKKIRNGRQFVPGRLHASRELYHPSQRKRSMSHEWGAWIHGGVGPSSMDERDLGAGDVSRRMRAWPTKMIRFALSPKLQLDQNVTVKFYKALRDMDCMVIG